jgi:hypothetical protein
VSEEEFGFVFRVQFTVSFRHLTDVFRVSSLRQNTKHIYIDTAYSIYVVHST